MHKKCIIKIVYQPRGLNKLVISLIQNVYVPIRNCQDSSCYYNKIYTPNYNQYLSLMFYLTDITVLPFFESRKRA